MASQVRAPRCSVLVGGASLLPIEANVHVSIHQSADTFFAKLPLDNAAGLSEAYWADTAPIPVEVRATNDANGAADVSMLIGQVDEVQLSLHDRTVGIRGRDLTAGLADLNTAELWRNRTNQDVISDLAGRVGLGVQFSADVDQAGLQYDQEYSEISDLDTAWNVIVRLAKRAGAIAFVKGQALYVQPIDADPSGVFTVNYQALPAQSNAAMIYMARNLNLSKDATTRVKSWRHKQGQTITSEYESKGKNASSDRLIFQHRGANLTKQQQDRLARAHMKETLSHERQVDISNLPGDVSVIAGLMGLRLAGTGTAFDQDYILADVTHHFSLDGGYNMDLSAHNQDASRGDPSQVH